LGVVIRVGADPKPSQIVSFAIAHRSIRKGYAHSPNTRIATKRVEVEAWVSRILAKAAISRMCLLLDFDG
jgi:hypothetical protein